MYRSQYIFCKKNKKVFFSILFLLRIRNTYDIIKAREVSYMNDDIKIGEALKRLRQSYDLTLENLANNLNNIYPDENYTKGKISKWERNADTPKLTSLKRLVDYFNISIDEVIKLQDECISDIIADEDYKLRIEEAKFKNLLIDKLRNLGYEFDDDAFNFNEFLVEELMITNKDLNAKYAVDPRELYTEMKHTFNRVEFLKAESSRNIEAREIRRTLEKLDVDTSTVKESESIYNTFSYIENVSAGTGYTYGDNETFQCYTDRSEFKLYDFATRIKGDSMEPQFKDGDIILVKSGYDNVNGGIYVIDYAGESYVKKLYNDGDRFRLVSINRTYENIIIDIPTGDDVFFNIVGKVVDSFTPLDA